MGKPDTPTPPDPKETAAAQTGTNISTAIANAYLGGVNQVGPDGSKTREQTGTQSVFDPSTGRTYDIPTFTETTTLSPEQQKLYDLNTQTQQQIGQVGLDQSQKIGDLLGTNVSLDNDAVESRLFDLGSKRLDPKFAQQEESLRTRLSNQGLQPGSAAWNAEMANFQQGKNDAYDQLALTGRGQSVQEILAERNQPINEITALLSGSQVSQPNFTAVNMPTIPTTDYAGIVSNNYNQQLQASQMQQQSQNAMLGGLFGLGAAGVYKWSDRRLKTDIHKIGETADNQNIYEYRYKGSDEPQVGLMAQEVEKKHPEAVATHPSGYKMVDYSKAVPMGSLLRAG